MQIIFTTILVLTSFFSLQLEASEVQAILHNREHSRALVIIRGAAAKDAFNVLEMPATLKRTRACSYSSDGRVSEVIIESEMKMGPNITCEREIQRDSYQCFMPFNAQDGGVADKTIQTLDFPCR